MICCIHRLFFFVGILDIDIMIHLLAAVEYVTSLLRVFDGIGITVSQRSIENINTLIKERPRIGDHAIPDEPLSLFRIGDS